MSTTKDYRDFCIEQLSLLENIKCKAMMGEYLLYHNNILFGGIYNNRLLIKITQSNEKYKFTEVLPYEGAKPMYIVDDLRDKENLKEIVLETCKNLPLSE